MNKYQLFLFLLMACFVVHPGEAQIWKKVKRKVERKVEEKADEKIDEIFEEKNEEGESEETTPTEEEGSEEPSGSNNEEEVNESTSSKEVVINSKFDFVPGDELLFFDDFSNDFIGDFPSKWNTNGGGEVVTFDDGEDKWLEMLSGYRTFYIPDLAELPEEYTIEFDFKTYGMDRGTSSTARLMVYLADEGNFVYGHNHVKVIIPLVQYIADGVRISNYGPKFDTKINNEVKADIRDEVLAEPHISIAVNKQRFRLWVNQKKYIDVPRLLPKESIMNYVKFNITNTKDGKERIFLRNVKIAKGGLDLRKQLIAEGKVSTNGILFDSGSAVIQAQSYGIIRQISQVLKQDKAMQLNIIGHTDSDGTEESNLTLSGKRAAAVKKALIDIYGIPADRMTTEGKGESEPVADNDSDDGKAKNRRVEFVKM